MCFTDIECIIFDLDGVLIDSAPDISLGVNATLEYFGYKSLPIPQITSFIGNGVRTLLKRSINAACNRNSEFEITNFSDNWHNSNSTADTFCEYSDNLSISPKEYSTYFNEHLPQNQFFQTIVDFYREYYQNHPVQKTLLYKNVNELLTKLKALNIPLAIASNKPRNISEIILKKLNVFDFFNTIVGPEDVTNIKPDSEMLILAKSKLENNLNKKFNCKKIVMVGDSASDIQAAKSFGCQSIAIKGGYGDTQKLLAEKANLVLDYCGDIINFL